MAKDCKPKVIYDYPWWWSEFFRKLQNSQIYAKGDKGDKGDPGEIAKPFSIPPPGCKKVKNLYVNEAGKFVIEYDDTPV